jgi:uncharacterized protein (DUF1800 family)
MTQALERISTTLAQVRALQLELQGATQQQLAQAQERLTALRRQLAVAAEQLEVAQMQFAAAQLQLTAAQRQQVASARDQLAVVRPITLMMPAQGQTIGAFVTRKVERAVYTDRQLEEVLTDFWFNHFNVSYAKSAQMRVVLADYERNAIRAHVFGRFEEMLAATAQHPAMMIYLDNFQSTAPQGPSAAPRPAVVVAGVPVQPQARVAGGLNENYARELMELHTIGVDGGYTQQDVIEVARAFTGWGITGSGQNVAFQFQMARHDQGEKAVLGRTFEAGGGMEEGLEILSMLASHPSTARHVATKLVRHFVADDPPQRLVAELAEVFRRTDGDLREVTRALFTSETFYAPAHYRAKVKRPFEFIVSALRATDALMGQDVQNPALATQLRNFRHLPYSEPAPTGYPTAAEDWLSAGAMLARFNFALDLTAGRIAGLRVDAWSVLGERRASLEPRLTPLWSTGRGRGAAAAPVAAAERDALLGELAATLVERTMPGVGVARLQGVIAGDLAAQPQAPAGLMARAVAIALGAPDFQRY